MDHESTIKERRSSSIFRLPFRSKKDKQQPRSQSVSFDRTSLNLSHRSSLDERKRNSGTYTRSGLRNSVTDTKYGVDVLEHALSNKTASSARSYPTVSVADSWERDKQTGEVIDHTDMLHALAPTQSQEDAPILQRMQTAEGTIPGQFLTDKFPTPLWNRILSHLSLADRASLSLTCKPFEQLTGTELRKALSLPENHSHRLSFLPHLDILLPTHLLCFDCAVYHLRINPTRETLRPANTHNPLYTCPNTSNPQKLNPRIRITSGRVLPFPFVQLAMRAHRFTPHYGVTTDSLSRRYKDKEGSESTWSHQTRFAIVNNHLLMRVTSQCFAPAGLPPAGERHLLYSRDDFVPYFSVCPHWRDGVLLPNVKCALSHIPKPPEGSGVNRLAKDVKLKFHPMNPIVVLCEKCRPMRRCPECATEYLIEIRMVEDKDPADPSQIFKQALVVTRWSDLGDGGDVRGDEWAAVSGGKQSHGGEYDSLEKLGKRAVSGLFEGEVYGDVIPGQKLLSMNPEKKRLGEEGHEWY